LGGEAPPFLDPDPPHWAARGLAYILISLFVVAVVGAVAVRVPEAVSCPFTLLPVHGTDPVRAPRSGLVGEVHASQAAVVRQGEPVFVIRSTDIADRSAELRTLEMALTGYEQHLANMRRAHASQVLADDEEGRKLDQQIAYLSNAIEPKRNQLAMTQELADRYATAYQEGIASWAESVHHRLEANGMALELAQLTADEREARTAREKLHHESEAHEATYAELDRGIVEEMEKTRVRAATLRQELINSSSNELAVPAPCAGTVLQLTVKGAGTYVHEGDVLCEVACSGEQLQAELMIPESGVGRIKSGQGIKLLYDAFPYQRYGVKYGTLRWVSPSSVGEHDGLRFRALADIETDAVVVDGQPRQLVAGMGGTARVVVGRRSVISAAFAPLRALQEAVGDAQGTDRKGGETRAE
jgi:multidrug efflux pump subunit AcrA (membrane-fusion protein)